MLWIFISQPISTTANFYLSNLGGKKPINSEKKIRLFGENIKRIKLLYIQLAIASLLKVSLNTPKIIISFTKYVTM